MISLIKKLTVIFILLLIVVIGLNVSNEGINKLLSKEPEPVVALNYSKQKLNLDLLGNSYEVDLHAIGNSITSVINGR